MFQHHAYLALQHKINPDEALLALGTNLPEQDNLYYQSIGIDDVRQLTARAFMMPQVGEKKLLVVTASDITVESQQALLKLLEEPPQSSVFLFILPTSTHLLSTLRSRFLILDLPETCTSDEAFTEFTSLGLAARLDLIADKLTNKDKDWVGAIKASLIACLVSKELPKSILTTLPTLNFVAEHLETRGASNRQLLEELALTWPIAAEK